MSPADWGSDEYCQTGENVVECPYCLGGGEDALENTCDICQGAGFIEEWRLRIFLADDADDADDID